VWVSISSRGGRKERREEGRISKAGNKITCPCDKQFRKEKGRREGGREGGLTFLVDIPHLDGAIPRAGGKERLGRGEIEGNDRPPVTREDF